jgi:FkbM family methyltransferase
MLIKFSDCVALIKLVHKVVPSGVLHIGAHIGEEIVRYSAEGISHITWVEANKELIPELTKNISRYAIDQRILNCALWDKDEQINFHITNNQQSSSIFLLGTHAEHYPQITVEETQSMQAHRLDTILALGLLTVPDIHFVNIDTQGSELAILKGFGKFLTDGNILGIYLEVNKEHLYQGIPLISEIDEYIQEFGYRRMITSWSNAGWGDAFYLKEREESE